MANIGAQIADLMGEFTLVSKSTTLVSNAAALQIVLANPMRWAIILSLGSASGTIAGGLVFNFRVPTSANDGIVLNNQLPVMSYNFRDYGAIVQQAFWVWPFTNNLVINVSEVILNR